MQVVVSKEVESMLKDGVTEPYSSPWSALTVLVKKPNDKLRMFLDLRKVNLFPGHIVIDARIATDAKKVKAINEFLTLRNVKRSFLVLASWNCCFGDGFTSVVRPLVKRMKKEVKSQMLLEQDDNFEKIK